jgi:hypothetical protein
MEILALTPSSAEIGVDSHAKQIVIGFRCEDGASADRFVLRSDDAFGFALDIVRNVVEMEKGRAETSQELLLALTALLDDAKIELWQPTAN